MLLQEADWREKEGGKKGGGEGGKEGGREGTYLLLLLLHVGLSEAVGVGQVLLHHQLVGGGRAGGREGGKGRDECLLEAEARSVTTGFLISLPPSLPPSLPQRPQRLCPVLFSHATDRLQVRGHLGIHHVCAWGEGGREGGRVRIGHWV